MWLLSTFGYQVGNFATTMLLIAIINALYGAGVVAQVASIELLTGVLGAGLLRLPLIMEHTTQPRLLLKSLWVARLMSFMITAIACVVFTPSGYSVVPVLLSVGAVCFTPAYELLKTSYRIYGLWIVSFRLVAAACMFSPFVEDFVLELFFFPQLLAGLLVSWSAAQSYVNNPPVLVSGEKPDSPIEAFFVSLILSALLAFSSQRLIVAVAGLGGYWVTLERLLRAGVAFSFPYVYRLFPNKLLLESWALILLFLVVGTLLCMEIYRSVDLLSHGLVIFPALLTLGVTWAGMSRPRSMVSTSALVLLAVCGSVLL